MHGLFFMIYDLGQQCHTAFSKTASFEGGRERLYGTTPGTTQGRFRGLCQYLGIKLGLLRLQRCSAPGAISLAPK